MAEVVIMPKLGFDMAEGTLVRWVIQEGEAVAKGAVLAEIETDKATVEVESNYDGVIARQLVAKGTVVPVNTPIAVVAQKGETVDYQALLGESAPTAPVVPAAAPAVVAPAAEQPKSAPTPASPAAPEAETEAGRLPEGQRVSPLARRIAREQSVNLSLVKGSGPGGRIVRQDIEAFLASPLPSAAAPARPVAAGELTSVSLGAPLAAEQVPLTRLRSAIARRMVEAKQQVPHFYVTHEYDMAALLDLRQQVNALLPEDEKISVNDFIVKAAALALREYPNLNASLDAAGQQVVRHGAVHMGVAVALDAGLLTVVARDADRKPLRLIAAEIKTMVARARSGKVRPEDIEGSTFSISNLGMFDVEHFIAIINPPEAAILAVGSAREVPVVKDGQVVPGMRMKASISVDHRVSDGAEAARFMQALAKYIERPLSLLV